jgi:pimeloyl-ACP methyl ester carboxylesterase
VMTQHPTQASEHEGAAASPPPLGQLYEAAGRRLWLHRSGSGGHPVVVFLPGASAVDLDYLNIHDQAATLTTSVLYDRGGTGWSDPAELPRTAAEVATELRDLLRAAGVPGPYLLAAHSLGGAYARRFAQLFPAEVAGVLYLDAFYEDTDAYMPERLHLARLRLPDPGRLQLALMRPFARRMYQRMFTGWPGPVRQQLIDPGMRLLMSGKALREMTDGKLRLYAALAGSVTRGEHRVLEDARHSTVTTDHPDTVIQAIHDLLDQVSP